MKKILIALFALLLLVGCSTKSYTNISDADDVIFKAGDTQYTKGDLYKALKVSSSESIEQDILNRIAENLNIDLSDVEKEADEMIDLYKEMGYEEMIISYYGSMEDFKKQYVNSGVITKLSESYINDNYDLLVAEDKPVKMQIASFSEEETANKFVDDITNGGKTFDTAAVENGYDTTTQAAVYLDSDDLPLNIKSYLNETVSTGLSSIILVSNESTDSDGNKTSIDTYYVLNIISRNTNDFKDDYIAVKTEKIGVEGVKDYMFSNHKIEFFDQSIYEMMSSEYEVFK